MASNRRLSYIRAGYEQRNSVANSNYFGYEKYGALGIREIMTEKIRYKNEPSTVFIRFNSDVLELFPKLKKSPERTDICSTLRTSTE